MLLASRPLDELKQDASMKKSSRGSELRKKYVFHVKVDRKMGEDALKMGLHVSNIEEINFKNESDLLRRKWKKQLQTNSV